MTKHSIAYVDTSVVIAILFGEPDGSQWARVLNSTSVLISSHLIEAELLSTACREKVAYDSVLEPIGRMTLLFPLQSLRKELLEVLSEGYCRGADTYHLATALWFAEKNRSSLPFFTKDLTQHKCAEKLGLEVQNFL